MRLDLVPLARSLKGKQTFISWSIASRDRGKGLVRGTNPQGARRRLAL